MALTKRFKIMELKEVKISKLLTDDENGITYGTSVSCPGALKLKVIPKIDTKPLKGDSTTQDVYARITEVDVEGECSVFNLDALPIMQGGEVSTSGTTPNQVNSYALTTSNATVPYFKIEGRWTYPGEGLGDAHITVSKLKVTDAPSYEVNDASGNFGTCTFKATAVSTVHDGAWYDMKFNETAVAIS
jgi:hypothetical protein